MSCSSVDCWRSSVTTSSDSDEGWVIIASAHASATRWRAVKFAVEPASTAPIVSSSRPASLATARRTDSQVAQSWWCAHRIRTISVVTGSTVANRTVAAAQPPIARRSARSVGGAGASIGWPRGNRPNQLAINLRARGARFGLCVAAQQHRNSHSAQLQQSR